MALDLDPAHIPTLAALRVLAIDAADWDRAARYLDQEQMNTEAPRAKAKLLVELGKLRHEMLGEQELAVQAYEMALASDPDNEDAALPLVDEYARTEQWPRAEPLAEMLAKKAGKRERAEQHRLQNMLGKVLSAVGKNEGALKAYQAAHHLDLTDPETIRGLADVSFKLGDWAGSLTNFQKVLASLGEEQTEERATVYYKLGLIKQNQGQAKPAVNNFEKALALDVAHRPTLDAMVSVYEGLKDWKQVCHYKRQILDNIMDGAERYKALHDIANVWIEKENNSPEGRRGPRGGGSRSRAAGPQAPPQAARSLRQDLAVGADGGHHPAHRRPRAPARAQEQVPLHDGAALPRQAERPDPRGRSLQRVARSEPERSEPVRSHQQDPHRAEGVEAARARLPEDAPPRGRQGRSQPRVHPLAQPGDHLPRPPAGSEQRDRGLQDGLPDEARGAAGARDPRSALRAERRHRGGDLGVPRAPQARPAQGRPVPQALPPRARAEDLRPGLVPRRGARVHAQGRSGGDAVLRGLPAQGHARRPRPPRQRAVDPEPLPRGGEHLHRQDLRDDRGRRAQGEAPERPAGEGSRPRCSIRASGRIRRRAR